MNSTLYRGYVITEENGRWCVNLGVVKGIECFGSLKEAKDAVDAREREVEEDTSDRP